MIAVILLFLFVRALGKRLEEEAAAGAPAEPNVTAMAVVTLLGIAALVFLVTGAFNVSDAFNYWARYHQAGALGNTGDAVYSSAMMQASIVKAVLLFVL